MDGRKKKFIKELLTKARTRRESGLYVVDGPKMCAELPPELVEELYVTREFLQSRSAPLCAPLFSACGYEEVSESDMKQLSDTVTPQGVVAVVRQRRIRGLAALLAESERTPLLFLLETIQDPGNLGTILRAAEAAGVTGIVMNGTCVDVYSPKVVRSTMGAVLRVPFLAVDDLSEAVKRLKSGMLTDGAPVRVYAAHLHGAVDYDRTDYTGPSAVMIGNESQGLTEELTALADQAVKIPMCGTVESLNAAMAAAILMFEASRQRRMLPCDCGER